MADRDPLLGTSVGNYAIERLIGEGGMGRVYLAHHTNLPNKRYAFKVLLGDHAASTAMRTRFTREAERASQLDHPNVVKVVDFGQTKHGLLYIVMDYVDGPSLVSLIGSAAMPPAQVIALARDICLGLIYAHDAGIVHRDLKPENILVSAGPTGPVPRIVDFGLALSVDHSDERLTESGMTMGTPLFAAPEQLLGRPLDHRADLFALGMTMFEMLTGGLTPIDGHMMEIVAAKTARDTPRISERAPELEVPAELDNLVARLTRRRPSERYASARDVIEALDRIRLPATGKRSKKQPRGSAQRDAAQLREVAGRRAMSIPGVRRSDSEPGERPSEPMVRFSRRGAAPPEAQVPTGEIAHRPARRKWLAVGLVSACGLAGALWLAVGGSAPPPGADAAEPPGSPPIASSAAPAGAPAAAAEAQTAAEATRREAEIEMPGDPDPAIPGRRRPHQRAARPLHDDVIAAEPARPPAAPSAPTVSGPRGGAPPAGPSRRPRDLRARLDHIDVTGSLPVSAVQRAIQRAWPAIASCAPVSPGAVVARFTIGEARRALGVAASGALPATRACIAAALAEVRTEAAPDVGDVAVTVRIVFAVGT